MGRELSQRNEVAHHVGTCDDFPLNEVRLFDLMGVSVGVVRTVHGFYAMRNNCPHQGAEVCKGLIAGTNVPSAAGDYEYGLDDELIICPSHGWEFFLATGVPAFGISTKRLITYPVRVDDSGVSVLTRKR